MSTRSSWGPPRALVLGILLVAAAACAPKASTPAPEAPHRTLTLEPCHLSSPVSAARESAQCATLTVPEDRSNPDGRKIDLYIAVLPAVSRSPQPDPLFLLAGGPGQAATEAYLGLLPLLEDVNKNRDLVLVDQRGTGHSHNLDCFQDRKLDDLLEAGEEGILELVKECRDHLDADLRFYTTPVAMQDLDDVREALGYQKINIYGASYGTRAALTYLHQFPDRVRSVILDGVVPQDLALGGTVARDAQRAVDLIFQRCASEEACSKDFPDVAGQFQQLLAELEHNPRQITVDHPLSGEPTTMKVTRQTLAGVVRLLSYTPETAALLPLLIHQTRATGDFRHLAAQGLLLGTNLGETLSAGMAYSVQCAEDAPFLDSEQARAWGETSYLGDFAASLTEVCALWPRGEVPADFKQPVTSDVPVLLLSGELDPVTPPQYGDQAAATLSHSRHLIAPGQGHNVLPRGCVPRIATHFIETADVTDLDTACVQELKPMPFFLNSAGPGA